jgi:hypothetical protein
MDSHTQPGFSIRWAMNHQQRVALYKQYMAAAGARMDAAAPPFWEAMWARGIELPPPPFLGAVVLGAFGALSMAAIPAVLWLFSFFLARGPSIGGHSVPWLWVAWLAAAAGLFGLVAIPAYYRGMARRYGLVRWASFAGVRQRT